MGDPMEPFDGADRERPVADAGIVRNRAKIDATINNARSFLDVAAEHGSFAGCLATFLSRPVPILTAAHTWADVPATTPESYALWTITCPAASGIGAGSRSPKTRVRARRLSGTIRPCRLESPSRP